MSAPETRETGFKGNQAVVTGWRQGSKETRQSSLVGDRVQRKAYSRHRLPLKPGRQGSKESIQSSQAGDRVQRKPGNRHWLETGFKGTSHRQGDRVQRQVGSRHRMF